MKRNDFIKNVSIALGSSVVLGCKTDLIGELISNENLESISIEEAKSYFENVYLKNISNLRVAGKENYKRIAKWDKAEKKTKNKEEYVIVPIEYEDDNKPGIIAYGEKEDFKLKFLQEFTNPIIEVLVSLKKNKKTEVFIAQMAYDPYALVNKNEKTLSESDYTGWIMKTDWNDTPLEGIEFKNGKQIRNFDKISKKAKVNCDYIYFGQLSVTYYYDQFCKCTVFVATRPSNWSPIGACTNWIGGQPMSSYNSYVTNSGSQPNNTFLPLANFRLLSDGIIKLLPERYIWNKHVMEVANAMGLFSNLSDLTHGSAEALARASMGVYRNSALPAEIKVLGGFGKALGFIGLGIDGANAYLTFADANSTQQQRDDALIALGLSALGFGTMFITGGWLIGVGIGGVSLYLTLVK